MAIHCTICQAIIPPEVDVRFLGGHLCPQHADLALHGARQVSDAFATVGLSVETQANLYQAFQGLKQAGKALAPVVSSFAKPPAPPAPKKGSKP
jgi:hypothetical protein